MWRRFWLTPYLHGPMYPAATAVLQLQPDDDLLDVAFGSGSFLAVCARQVRFAAGLDGHCGTIPAGLDEECPLSPRVAQVGRYRPP
jgi:hypothetical protein